MAVMPLLALARFLAVAQGFGPQRAYRALTGELNSQIPEELRKAKVPGLAIALVDREGLVWAHGYGVADVAKQTWAVALLLGIGYILGFRVGTNPLAVLAAFALVLVSTLAIAWAMVLVAMLAANPEKVQIFGFVVLFPITFTSDAFVRTASMPGWLQAWSKANPVSLVADAVRGLMVSGPVGRPTVEAVAYAVAFTVVFAPLAVRAFKRRVLQGSARPVCLQ